MQGLQQLVAFAETAKRGSFAAAARELGSAPSTLAKAVARLEDSLGVKLFHRTTRQVNLTADGERLFARCQRVLSEVEDLHAEASGTRARPSGLLRVDLPIVYGRVVLLPVLGQLVQRHPELKLDVRLHDSYTDLIRDGIDLAVRVGPLADSQLVARRFAQQQMVLCASPEYLRRHGTPERIDQLHEHAAVVHRMPSSGRLRPWRLTPRGQTIEIEPASRVQISDGEGMAQAALQGLGLTQLPDYMVAQALGEGRLVEVLPTARPPADPISVVVPRSRHLPARVRVAVDALVTLGRAQGDESLRAPSSRRA
ncbi:LysR family transcriptional regulator [Ramlibacter rhizophilus]|uniref:LysR family transcriptional regulator n=1 Tax=Ramlibacter rhizophilus TaxID=1781167 RepID=A0A4Z0BKG7_9BURK|nr:LysR family transcriptional regulator [Ramlibacter rhizophilus]TFY98584.1 LysR family transcriptional regulator [Ramlibacter rhizophilus]